MHRQDSLKKGAITAEADLSVHGLIGPAPEVDIEGIKPGAMIWFLTFIAGISGLLFGYDTGVISGALVVIGTDLGGKALTSFNKELITSATALGALIGGLGAGSLADFIGRKWVIGVANVIFVAGSVIQAAAPDLWTMIGGRFVIGWGVGLASLIVPLYIAELAPASYRGRMVVINVLFITFGQVVAYAIDVAFEHVPGGWRYMVGGGAIPAIVQLVTLFILPETPRYLCRKDKLQEAAAVLQRIYPSAGSAEIQAKIENIHAGVKEAGQRHGTYWQNLVNTLKKLYLIPANFRALVIACGLQGIQQLCGWNSLMYFSATIFQTVGFANPIATSLIVACTNFVFTIVAFNLIDRIGRRRILLCTVWGMSLALVLAAIAFHYLPRNASGAIEASHSDPWAAVVLFSMMLFAAFYATGIGNVPWQQSELFPYEVRGIGTGMATATNWGGNLIIGSTFLTLMDRITPSGTFGLYAGICFLGWLFVIFCYPETSGFTIEEIGELLQHGFGIKESQKRRAAKQAAARGNIELGENGSQA
ncbi:myo-inositol transporter itr1 [Saitoella coloradoensis]